MPCELWNTRTGNQVASFAGEEAALAFVRGALRDRGADDVARLALVREDQDGRSVTIAIGPALVAQAREDAYHPDSAPAAAGRPV